MMTSAPKYAEILEKFRACNGDGLGKGRETRSLLIKPKEDLQLLKSQLRLSQHFKKNNLITNGN
jgi:hypothetical protein